MYQQEKCACCHSAFTQANLARILPSCGHNACTKCLKKLIASEADTLTCLFCRNEYPFEEDDIQSFPKNISIIKYLRESSSSASLNSDAAADRKNSLIETDNSGSLLISQIPVMREVSKCPEHGIPLEIVCTVDKGLLCAHCALFGQHRSHQLKTMSEFEKDIEKLNEEFKAIQKRKKICDEMISGVEYRTSVKAQIQNKKKAMIMDMNQRFLELSQFLKDTEARVYQQLIWNFKSIEKQIEKAAQQSQNYLQYDQWYNEAEKRINQLTTSNEILQKVDYVYHSPIKHQDGNKFLDQIQSNNKNTLDSLNLMIDGIAIEYSVSIKNYLDSYVRITNVPIELTPQNCLIDLSKSMKLPKKEEEACKPIKAEFVKSEEVLSEKNMDSSAEPSIVSNAKNFRTMRIKTNEGPQKSGDVKGPICASMNIQNRQSMKNPTRVSMKSPTRASLKSPTPTRESMKSPTRHGVISPSNNRFRQKSSSAKMSVKDMKKSQAKEQTYHPAQISRENIEFAEKYLSKFREATETLDLTGCNFEDHEIFQVVSVAATEKPIKCMKVSRNKLTNTGLAKILYYLGSATFINVSFNSLTDDAVDEFIKKREILPNLKIINLSNNRLNERKVKNKIQQLKRGGVIATI